MITLKIISIASKDYPGRKLTSEMLPSSAAPVKLLYLPLPRLWNLKGQKPCPNYLCISSPSFPCLLLWGKQNGVLEYEECGEWGGESGQQWFALFRGWSLESPLRTIHTHQTQKIPMNLMLIWPRTHQNMEAFVLRAIDCLFHFIRISGGKIIWFKYSKAK